MDILPYTEDHRIFRDSVRKFFAKEVIPYVEEWEEAGMVPRSAWKKMGDNGFLCMQVPEEYGGLEADFLYSVILMEELARSNHFGLLASLHSDIVVPYILSYGSDDLKRKYLPACLSGDTITAVAMTEPMREVILLPCALLRWTMAITSSSMARRRLSAMVLSVTLSYWP
jgi:acyl-CoA dehydrogenase